MRIHAIQTGTVAIRERQRAGTGPGPARPLLTLADRRWTEPLPILAWVVEHPDGLILVDTGEKARAAERGYFPAWNPYFRFGARMQVTPAQEVGPQLEALGFSPADVRTVVLTHLHTDHAGGLHHFPDSELLVSRTELGLATGRLAKVLGYLPHRWPAWFAPRAVEFEDGPFGPFERSHALAEGVTLVPTPGHTPGHLSVVVRSEQGSVFLAGDTSYTQDLMLAGVADGVTTSPATDRDSLRRIRELARSEPTVYVPTHDPDAPRRLEAMEAVGSPRADPHR
jgi:glyoxylase-like metal-dependent hydrolase (beta-lactamase superfamily II)